MFFESFRKKVDQKETAEHETVEPVGGDLHRNSQETYVHSTWQYYADVGDVLQENTIEKKTGEILERRVYRMKNGNKGELIFFEDAQGFKKSGVAEAHDITANEFTGDTQEGGKTEH